MRKFVFKSLLAAMLAVSVSPTVGCNKGDPNALETHVQKLDAEDTRAEAFQQLERIVIAPAQYLRLGAEQDRVIKLAARLLEPFEREQRTFCIAELELDLRQHLQHRDIFGLPFQRRDQVEPRLRILMRREIALRASEFFLRVHAAGSQCERGERNESDICAFNHAHSPIAAR